MRATEPIQHCRTEKDPEFALHATTGVHAHATESPLDWPRIGVAPPLVSEPSEGQKRRRWANTGIGLRHPQLPRPQIA
jgi:hypothetical protein